MSDAPTILDLLAPERLIVSRGCPSKWDLIDQLVDLLPQGAGYTGDLAAARQAVLARENQLTTGLEAGVALPHGPLPPPSPPVAAFSVCPEGITFDALDGLPTHFVLLMVFGDDAAGRERHLLSLAEAVSLFSDDAHRSALLSASTDVQLWDRLQAALARP